MIEIYTNIILKKYIPFYFLIIPIVATVINVFYPDFNFKNPEVGIKFELIIIAQLLIFVIFSILTFKLNNLIVKTVLVILSVINLYVSIMYFVVVTGFNDAETRKIHKILNVNDDNSKVIVYSYNNWKTNKLLFDTCIVEDYWIFEKRVKLK